MSPWQVIPLQDRVELGVMAMNGYFILPWTPELELHHKLQFSIIPKTNLFWIRILSFYRGYSQCILSTPDETELIDEYVHIYIYIYIYIHIVGKKWLQCSDKAMVKAALLREVNSKIETEERSSSIKLTCRHPLMGKVQEKVLWNKTCSFHSH